MRLLSSWYFFVKRMWACHTSSTSPGGTTFSSWRRQSFRKRLYHFAASSARLRLHPLTLAGGGLLLALASGLPGLLLHGDFLRHVWLEAELLGLPVKQGTAFLFDLAVYGAVLGATVDQIESAITDEEGLYRFEGLDAGIFCVAIDALSTANVDLLIPGNWTWPAPGTGRQGIRIASGEERLTIDFGWEFQN